MQYAVMLYFDDETNMKVKSYMDDLKNISNNEYMLGNNMPPHITLAMWNSDYNYINEITQYAEASKPFEVPFSSIGFFNDEERHIFLSPVKNKSLTTLHEGLYEIIKLKDESGYIEMYRDINIWVPHVTFGYQVHKDRFAQALSMCADIKMPIKATAKKIAVAMCCPFLELAVIDLGK